MKFTSEKEANQFSANVEMARKILKKIEDIGNKENLTKSDRKELLSLQSQLYEINNWFEETAN